MKICLFGISDVALGKHNVKDVRLDQADKLVEAKKKTYVQADLVGEDELSDTEAIITSEAGAPDLILKDLEFVEMRLGRNAEGVELGVLQKLKTSLDKEQFLYPLVFTPEEKVFVASYGLTTLRPVVVAKKEELGQFDSVVLVKTLKECGYISYLTVGGKENRAWQIRKGINAWESAGVIHSDIQKGFIRAEIISFEDLVATGGETQAKRAGKMRLETKDYIIQDYDVVNFRFNK